jgi:hypothetical protein
VGAGPRPRAHPVPRVALPPVDAERRRTGRVQHPPPRPAAGPPDEPTPAAAERDGLPLGRELAAAFGGLVAFWVSGCAGDPFADLPDPRQAEDCVAFTREANADAGQSTDDILSPGKPPTVDIEAYWFGPRLGPRRAIVANEGEVDLSATAEARLYPIYVVFYQLPADGCQSNLLPGYEPSPDYWHAGREVSVQSEPLDAPLAQRIIREVGGGIDGKPRVPVADGRSAVVLELGETTTGLVVDETFVLVQGAHPERVRALLPTFRRVGEAS